VCAPAYPHTCDWPLGVLENLIVMSDWMSVKTPRGSLQYFTHPLNDIAVQYVIDFTRFRARWFGTHAEFLVEIEFEYSVVMHDQLCQCYPAFTQFRNPPGFSDDKPLLLKLVQNLNCAGQFDTKPFSQCCVVSFVQTIDRRQVCDLGPAQIGQGQ